MKKTLIGLSIIACSVSAHATANYDVNCGCVKTPTAYDKAQDVKIAANTTAIGDVKLTSKQAFDIAVEGRATAGNALSTVYGLIPQVNNNTKSIEDLKNTKVDKNVFEVDRVRQDNALQKEISERQTGVEEAKNIGHDAFNKASDAQNTANNAMTNAETAIVIGQNADNKAIVAQAGADDAKEIGHNAFNKASDAYNTANNALIGVGEAKDLAHNANNNAINAGNNAQTAIEIGQNANNNAINAQNTADIGVRLGQDNSNAINVEQSERVNGDKMLQGNIDKNKSDQTITDNQQNAVISTKVDNNTFLKDQQRQDNALQSESTTRGNADKALAQQISDESTTRSAAVNTVQRSVETESASRKSADSALSKRIDNNDSTLVQHDERITSNSQRIGSVENRLNNTDQQNNKRFSDIDKRMGDNRKLASAGIAGAGAMANIPQVSQDSTFSVGAGAGGYDGQNAVAVGFSARINHNIVTKVSASTNSASEVLWGAGASVEW